MQAVASRLAAGMHGSSECAGRAISQVVFGAVQALTRRRVRVGNARRGRWSGRALRLVDPVPLDVAGRRASGSHGGDARARCATLGARQLSREAIYCQVISLVSRDNNVIASWPRTDATLS
jgi:hypothetical protein